MALGLGTRLAEDPLAEAERMAAEIAALPPLAIRHIKLCARATVGDDPDAGKAREDAATAAIAVTDEFHDRVQAFVNRRTARA
jgi:enoyl-CoA hydratase/carnithine racemase